MESSPAVQYAMGTVMSHRGYGERAQECLEVARSEVARLETLFSRFIPESDISRVNRSAGFRREPVSRETFDLLSQAVEFSAQGEGCFDVTIGPLVNLWREAKKRYQPPSGRAIAALLPLTGHTDLILDPDARTAGLARPGQSIDLGGIGKGYAGGAVLDIYRKYGIKSACSNMGGHVVTVGSKPDGSPWQIGIQHPRCDEALIGAVSVIGKSVVTSGDYQRYFKDQTGTHYHHILDPLTGYPADAGLTSVTIISDSSITADALSTMVFVAGLASGLEMLSGYPEAEAVLIDREMRVWITPGLESSFNAPEGIETVVMSKEMDF
jgi:FAD:protein FMN transferase